MFRHLDVSAVCTDDDQVTVNEKEDQVNPDRLILAWISW